jgi:enoyl-CoA hydratase/carnithine racemase
MLELGTDKLLARVERGIGFITINNPERRNAISLEMWRALGDAMAAFEADDEVRVAVLSGAGGRAFASGADISEFEQQRANSDQRKSYGEVSQRGYGALATFSKPSIAMISGYCLGGGLLLALAADLRFATEGSKFGVPAAKLGLGYDYPGVAALARVVGPARSADILFSARQLDANEAREIGLINFVVPETELATRVEEYARQVSENAPLTVRAIKASLRVYARQTQLADASSVEPLVSRCFNSEDYREGRRAFMEKRKPRFQGR